MLSLAPLALRETFLHQVKIPYIMIDPALKG